MFKPIFKIKNKNNLCWYNIFRNPNAIYIIETYIHSKQATPDNLAALSQNPEAIHLLLNNESVIHWHYICSNKSPDLMKLINKHIDKFNKIPYDKSTSNMKLISSNHCAMPFLKNHFDRIYWPSFSENECDEAIEILKQHPEKIHWVNLSLNKCAISLLESNIDKVYWSGLSRNPNALDILDKYPDQIDWTNLIIFNNNHDKCKLIKKYITNESYRNSIIPLIKYYNTMDHDYLFPIELLDMIQFANLNDSDYWYFVSAINDKRILPMLEENVDKLNHHRISLNPCAIPLLEKYPHLMVWGQLGYKYNPESLRFIATLDIKRMIQQCKKFASELMAYVFHPMRIERIASSYGLDLEEYLEQI